MALTNADHQWAHRQRQRRIKENQGKALFKLESARYRIHQTESRPESNDALLTLREVDDLLRQAQNLLLGKQDFEPT